MSILIEAIDFLLSKIEGKDATFGGGHYHLSSKDIAKRDFYRQALKDSRFWISLADLKGTQVLKCFKFESWNQIDELESMARQFKVVDCLVTIGDQWYDVYLGYYANRSRLADTAKIATIFKLEDLFVYF